MNTIQQIIKSIFNSLLNPWVLFGFAAQAVFFARVVVQWIISEKRKEIIVPVAYWYLGIIGSAMIFIYAIHRDDIVFIVSGFLNLLICIRSLIIHNGNKNSVSESI